MPPKGKKKWNIPKTITMDFKSLKSGPRKPNYQGYVSGLPKVRRAKMRYNETVELTSTLGSLDVANFRANGVYDPNMTGVGHQPFGYDTWSAQYNHYVVTGSKITVNIMPQNTTGAQIAGVYLGDDSSNYTDSTGFIEAKKGTWKAMYLRSSGALTVGSKYSAKQFFNVKDVRDNQDRLGAVVGATPSETALYGIWFQTKDASTASIWVNVVIDYIVEFSEPKDIAQS